MAETFQHVGEVFSAAAGADAADGPAPTEGRDRVDRALRRAVLVIDGAELTLYLGGRAYELRWPQRLAADTAAPQEIGGRAADPGVLLPVIGPAQSVDRDGLVPGRVLIRATEQSRGRRIVRMPCCGRSVVADIHGRAEPVTVCCHCHIAYRVRLLHRGDYVAVTVAETAILVAAHGRPRR